MANDTELLKSYVTESSESAFGELVHRHINTVYAAAFRELSGNGALAEEVCQMVFLELARKSSQLCGHPALAGWIYTCVRRMAANVRRTEARRQRREAQAQAMSELSQSGQAGSGWLEIKPILDDAMHELNEYDRAAVVLRFFEQRTIEDVGSALGLTKGAAHMRIDRAVGKLRLLLSKRGVTSTVPGLAAALAVGATLSAPSGLAASVISSVLTSTATTGTTALLTKVITMTKLKMALAGALIVGGIATPLVLQHQTQTKLKQDNDRLRQQLDEQAGLLGENQQLSNQLSQLSAKLQTKLPDEQSELLRLRGEVSRLRRESQERQVAKMTRNPKPARPSQAQEGEDRATRIQNQLTQAMDLRRAALDVAVSPQANSAPREGAVTLVADESGNQHLMQLTNGNWQEIENGGSYVATSDGTLAFRGNNATNSTNVTQVHYATLTNSPAATAH
ncbi:MAG TPA: sigma-70 family RNA polymerase sigma factor [Verrucomicrobiae bacterium]|nr:sigma-70 family RNA polymerase sigma factor [Verrucomicrobiae bacterium]